MSYVSRVKSREKSGTFSWDRLNEIFGFTGGRVQWAHIRTKRRKEKPLRFYNLDAYAVAFNRQQSPALYTGDTIYHHIIREDVGAQYDMIYLSRRRMRQTSEFMIKRLMRENEIWQE